MDWLEFLKVGLLALFQGVAEFLPISSSGHLQVLGYMMDFDPEESFVLTVILHGGSLAAILVFYFSLLWGILKNREFRLIWSVIIGSLPVVAVGLALKLTGLDDEIFAALWVPAIGFAITGVLLLRVMKPAKSDDAASTVKNMSWKQALVIGLVQAVAITPGISRSGSTIAAGMRAGLAKADCAKFSFLLAIPAIAGAMLLEVVKIIKAPEAVSGDKMALWAFGFAVSAVVGYFSLKLLLGMLQRGKLRYFGWYMFAASCFTFGLWVGSYYIKG